MATSNSVDFNLTRDEIIREALEIVGAIGADETPSPEDNATAARSLEQMVKMWQADGLHLWAQTEATLFLAKSTQRYALGASGDHATNGYVQTTLTADAAGGATSLTVDSIAGISDADYLGVELDDGTLQWTTVSGAPTGSAITAAASLDSAASSGNAVFAYTAKLNRPLRISSARLKYLDGTEIPVNVLSREDYMRLTTKGSNGKVVQVYYDPQLGNGQLYVWPTADDVSDVLRFTYSRPLEDFDSTAVNPDFPSEWLYPLSINLASMLAGKFGAPMSERAWIKQEAAEAKAQVLAWDQEWAPVMFQPDMSFY